MTIWKVIHGKYIQIKEVVLTGLRLQGHSHGSSVRNIFEGLFTEEVTGSVKDIFEGGFKIAASEERKKLNSTASSDR